VAHRQQDGADLERPGEGHDGHGQYFLAMLREGAHHRARIRKTRKRNVMDSEHKTTTRRGQWLASFGILVVLLMMSPVPGYAFRGHGFRHGHGFHHGHGFRHGGVFIRPSIVFPIGPYVGSYWGPYAYPYAYPPVVVESPPQVYVQPAPQESAQPPAQSSWYYCEESQGYYPYVQQCPGGWRPVAPTP